MRIKLWLNASSDQRKGRYLLDRLIPRYLKKKIKRAVKKVVLHRRE